MGMLSKITKLRKNKQFGYQPRFYKGKEEGNSPFAMEQRFEKYRSTASHTRGLKNKVNKAMDDMKVEGDRNLKIRMLIIVTVLLLIFLFIIDFDLSIFFK